MAKFIKQLHDLLDLAVDKGVTEYISRSQFDDTIDQGQMILFRRLCAEFVKTGDPIARNYLLPFSKKGTIALTAGVGNLPTGVEHEIEFKANVSGTDYPVYLRDSTSFEKSVLVHSQRNAFRSADPVYPTTVTKVFGRIYGDGTPGATGVATKKIEVSPTGVTAVSMLFVRRPVKPSYATTTVNGQLVYDDTNSQDVEWSALVQDILIENTLALLGLNMRDGQVQRAGQKSEAKEVSV